jgi:hypothetical protein
MLTYKKSEKQSFGKFWKKSKDKDLENLELEKICMTTCCNHQNEILQKSSIKIKHLMIWWMILFLETND